MDTNSVLNFTGAALSSSIDAGDTSPVRVGLVKYICDCFDAAKQHRNSSGVDDRMLSSLRAVRGEYDEDVLSELAKFGGSRVYARITATKVRGVAALLREIYTADKRPYAIDSTPVPSGRDDTAESTVSSILRQELAELVSAGVPVTDDVVAQRKLSLNRVVQQGKLKQAREGLRQREEVLDDVLWEGGFYAALWDFLLDIAAYPYACIKGPVVRYKRRAKWENGKVSVVNEPSMNWTRVSPFDVYFAPWAHAPQDGYIIHRQRTTREALQNLLTLPSYDSEAILRVLESDGSSLTRWEQYVEGTRASLEQRQSDTSTSLHKAVDQPMPMLEFHGPLSGKLLLEWGMSPDQVPDPARDVHVTAWLVADEVVGVRVNPHPTGKKPFYVDSFERVPGSIYGHGVPDLINDVQAVGNATLRALVNNLAMASGPMVAINEDRLAPSESDAVELHPWRVFRTVASLSGNDNSPPVSFFQPGSNSAELLGVYERLSNLADEMSSLPKFLQGNPQGLGALGRTSSGVAMLVEGANRTIKQTVSSIDSNVIEPVVQDLNTYLALTRPDFVEFGDIDVVARGAVELVQKETLRLRRIEFLNATNNPTDVTIVGAAARAALLREVARDLGLPVDEIVPETADQTGTQPQIGQPAQQTGQQQTAPADQVKPTTQGVARAPTV